MKDYLSVKGVTETLKVIEKSKFITTSSHVENEDEARAFIAGIQKKYSDATHNCFAFVSDPLGNLLRFSDDGEPQGTAGMPILEAIRAKSLMCTAVVVTRYFGGIKLGAGGLLRAYSNCTSENLDAAKKVVHTECVKLKCTVDYPLVDTTLRFLEAFDCTTLDSEYLNKVSFIVAVKSKDEATFISQLTDKLQGKLEIERIEEYIAPFEI